MRPVSYKHIWVRCQHALIPAGIALLLCIPKLNQGALATDTAWYSAIAMRAWSGAADGDLAHLWSLLGVADQPYFNKPPLAFWMNGAPLAALGPTVLAARLGSVLACVLCVLAVARLGRLLGGRAVGLGAGVVLALTWEFVRHARAFSLDLWVTLFLVLAACSVATAVRAVSGTVTERVRFRFGPFAAAGAWIGLALMVKPVVPLLTLPLLGAWLCVAGRGRWVVWLGLSLAVAFAAAAPWHLSMWDLHGAEFTAQYFGREVIGRAAAAPIADVNQGSGSPAYYLAHLLKNYWPWLATSLFGYVALARTEGSRRQRAALWLSLIWCGGWLLALSLFPDKRPRYMVVIYPFAALASAVFLSRLAPVRIRAVWRRVTAWALPVAAAAALALSIVPLTMHRPNPPQWAALFAWLGTQDAPLFVGGFAPQRSAQVYLATGRWPTPTRSTAGVSLVAPTEGGLILYHRRDGFAPGENETVVFDEGDLSVTRLDAQPWSPHVVPDPGEAQRP